MKSVKLTTRMLSILIKIFKFLFSILMSSHFFLFSSCLPPSLHFPLLSHLQFNFFFFFFQYSLLSISHLCPFLSLSSCFIIFVFYHIFVSFYISRLIHLPYVTSFSHILIVFSHFLVAFSISHFILSSSVSSHFNPFLPLFFSPFYLSFHSFFFYLSLFLPILSLSLSPGASISDFLLDLVDEDTVVLPGYRGARGMTALVSC